jgi:hypothetical protein
MWAASHPDGQFADYTEERLLAFLDRHQLTREPGAQFEYSNLGMGLVGYLLTRVAKSDYETLVRTRITGPLGMKDTMITLTPSHAARLAAPFDAYMRPAKPNRMAALEGAGAIRSTVADMLIFAKALLDPTSPIAPVLKTALSVRAPGENPITELALGWVVRRLPGRELLMHNGLSYGFSSVLILEPAKGRAVVALVNSAAEPRSEDLAFNIVGIQPVAPTPAVRPAPPPFVPRKEISLPAAELDKVAGRYDFGSGLVVTITRDGEYLYAESQRQGVRGPRLQIVPEAPLAFFWKAMDAQIRFTTDASGMVTGAEGSDRGKQMVGRRVAPEENTLSKVEDLKTLARYVGAYQMAPGMNMVVTLEGSQLVTKPGNQSGVPIFPESETKFFAKVAAAKIEFEFAQPDPDGVPGQLIMRQNGRTRTMNRLSEAEFKQIEAER